MLWRTGWHREICPAQGFNIWTSSGSFQMNGIDLPPDLMMAPPPSDLNIPLRRKLFPYLYGGRKLFIQAIAIFFEAKDAEPSVHRIVELWVDKEGKAIRDTSRKGDVYSIQCVATEDLPGLFHGQLPVELGPIPKSGTFDLGALRFDSDVGDVSETFIIFRYIAR